MLSGYSHNELCARREYVGLPMVHHAMNAVLVVSAQAEIKRFLHEERTQAFIGDNYQLPDMRKNKQGNLSLFPIG